MIATLRPFLTPWPWRIKVLVGCLGYTVFIVVVPRMFPSMASWPWGIRVVLVGLAWVALLVMLWMLAHVLKAYVFAPFLKETLDTRSPKAKEKLADSLMSVGTAIHSASPVAVLIFPVTAFINAVVSGWKDPVPMDALAAWLTADWRTWVRLVSAFGRWIVAHALFLFILGLAFFLPSVSFIR
jgi:hypothetical protein